MARGGYRAGAGRPVGSKPGAPKIDAVASAEGMTPLEYMLQVMQDPTVEEARRDRMAIAAAPFVHVRACDLPKAGKKEQAQEKAEEIAAGRFSPAKAPLRVVND